MRYLLLAVVLVSCLQVGCANRPSFDEIEATNNALAADVLAETGRESLISFMKDGSDLTITVALVATSKSDAEAAKPTIEAIVVRHWPHVNSVVVEAQP